MGKDGTVPEFNFWITLIGFSSVQRTLRCPCFHPSRSRSNAGSFLLNAQWRSIYHSPVGDPSSPERIDADVCKVPQLLRLPEMIAHCDFTTMHESVSLSDLGDGG